MIACQEYQVLWSRNTGRLLGTRSILEGIVNLRFEIHLQYWTRRTGALHILSILASHHHQQLDMQYIYYGMQGLNDTKAELSELGLSYEACRV
jgi:hypothetical protein